MPRGVALVCVGRARRGLVAVRPGRAKGGTDGRWARAEGGHGG